VAWSSEPEVWSVSVRDGSLRRILPRKEDGRDAKHGYYDPAFSPKGDFLYFAATHNRYLNPSLWRMRTPAAPGGAWGEPERVTSDGTAAVRQIAVSPRSGTVAYAAPSIASNLWSLPLDPKSSLPSGDPVALTRTTGGRNTTPRFSPDGSTIAFISSRAGTASDVWLIGRDGGEARPLTEGADAFSPNWLPAGDRIAFFTSRGRKKGLWTVSREDRSQRLLLELADDVYSTRLSKDGTLLALTRSTPEIAVWVQPVAGGEAQRLTPDGQGASFPCWSPDGRTLAVEILRSPDEFVGLMPAAGGVPTILVDDKGASWPWDWSPDGERIAFAGNRAGVWNIYWVARSGGPSRRLTQNRNRHAFLRYPAWSPQGDRIVYAYAETTGNI